MSNEYSRYHAIDYGEYPGWPDVTKVRGSIIPNVFPKVALLVGWSFFVMAIDVFVPNAIGLPAVIIPSLSVVLGLLLVFRTNTAYDRFWEGRKTFSTLMTSVRTMSRYVWLGVSPKVSTPHEKRQFLDLLLAYIVSIKHHLRDEYGTNYPDLEMLLPEQIKDAENHQGEFEIQPRFTGLAGNFALDPDRTMNLPLEISYYLGLYQQRVYDLKGMDVTCYANFFAALTLATDCLSVLERIRSTPIPISYSIHLKQSLFLYCLLLPFTLVDELGALTPFIMGVVAFTLFGIESIALEIENPFGYDKNDLPIDHYCDELRLEFRYLASRVPEKGDILHHYQHPHTHRDTGQVGLVSSTLTL
ncbi:MAG: Bestrophin/UPF0187 [Piptocephalis tieghemiana]|nr:MAG: Bestrophin/UPF0187 [Piptocephalis tieghemiana]